MAQGSEPENIYTKFRAGGTFLKAASFGTGHIHDTYKIETEGSNRDYLLQRINTQVFTDVAGLQENIYRVSRHIRQKLIDEGEKDIERKCLTLIKTHDGKTWYRDTGGHYWRMFLFIPGHHSYDVVKNKMQAYEGGRAIGCFQYLLSDLPGPRLNETIPHFHDIGKRLETFHKALNDDVLARKKEVGDEIKFVLAREEEMKTILRLGQKGEIPLRITHNDTKFNNILLDENDRALCLIDLDTVMPGYVHYDFGDSLRTAANTAAEDEEDLSKIKVDLDIFSSFSRGYLDQIKNILKRKEIEYLAHSPALMAFIMGVRFLTDYIMGDVYYKIHDPEHNIRRARAQFRLIENFEDNLERMNSIIMDIVN